MTGRYTYLLCVLILAACTRQGPQIPSRWLGSEPEVDTAQLAIMEFNQRMASEADAELLRYVQQQPESYALYRPSAWVHIYSAGDEAQQPLQPGKDYTLHIRTYTLDQRLLTDVSQTCKLTVGELPYAVVEVLRELYPGAKARLIVPWYNAYGMHGNQQVPPYENVIIDISVIE